MTQTPGTRLGPYEIVSPLGAGGMGEVYRARDSRLSRDVAVKVLPAAVASDAERLKRFEKEARSASSLNHPNIVTIHDIGSERGVFYMAMELVEGQTLREILAEGALSTKRLLSVASQVADGLARAHGAGIVHRDLKPENVMATRDGLVKILDFGLAKLAQAEDTSGATAAPTVSGATQPGVVLGTAGYMSPEQALGRTLDFRSDQFSFGSILYEMATGKRAFSRGSMPETLTAIIRDEPEPIADVSPVTPVPLRWIVERCLAKNPEDRYASTRDLARDLATLKDRLTEVGSGPSAVAAAAGRLRTAGWRRAAPWALSAFVAGAVLAWGASRLGKPPAEPAAVLRFSVGLPPGVELATTEVESHFAISPDGRWLAIAGSSGERELLYLRSLDSFEVRPIPGTEGAITPFWSPDSRYIGFFSEGKIRKVPLAGGPAEAICDAGLEAGPSWGSTGQILFMQLGPKAGIWVLSANGGEPRRLFAEDEGGPVTALLWPKFLPDGKRFLFVTLDRSRDRSRMPLRLGSLDSSQVTTIGQISSRVEFVRPGYLLYVREGVLLAQRFDERKARFTGEPTALAEHVSQFNGPLMAGFSASQTGIVAYTSSAKPGRAVWLDRTGREIGRLPEMGAIQTLRLSPDGKSAALGVNDEKKGSSDIWTYDFDRKLPARVTLDPRDEKNPVWSADGQSIYFRADWGGPPDVYRVPARSPEAAEPLIVRPGVQFPVDASRDGRLLLFSEYLRRTNGDLLFWPLAGDGKPAPLTQTPFDETGARFSPDGRWVAYRSNESGTRDVYLRPVGESAERLRVSSGGGSLPRFRGDGRELYYVTPDGRIVAVALSSGLRPEPGAEATLFHVEGVVRDYDVDSSGQRFLVAVAEPDASPISVVVNWPALLPK